MAAKSESKPKVIRVAEVAKLLDVSKPTVYRLLDEGVLPQIRFGRSRRVPLAAVEELLRGTRTQAAS